MITMIVSGSRYATSADRDQIAGLMASAFNLVPATADVLLRHGDGPAPKGCVGVDRLAASIAEEWGWDLDPHPADWAKFREGAGPIRNRAMCLAEIQGRRADLVLALPAVGRANKGTLSLIKEAIAANLSPIVVRPLVLAQNDTSHVAG